jgi:hypothetical protein
MNAKLTWALYDAELIRIERACRLLVFRAASRVYVLPTANMTWWTLGTFGRLSLRKEPAEYTFRAYPDQRLRRIPALDDAAADMWAWTFTDTARVVLVKAGLIPGQNGAVVPEDTRALGLGVPYEFVQFCARFSLRPADVLRGFIADLCSLHNVVSRPREDGYGSNGRDERMLARTYFECAYGWREMSNDPVDAEVSLEEEGDDPLTDKRN